MSIPVFFILSITSLRIVFGGSEAAITYQCAKHRNTAARIAPFNSKCAGHMPAKGSIHCHDYNEDVFPCVQFFRTYDRFDAPTFVEYFKAVQRHFGKVVAVVDRASPHRAKSVKELLRENKNTRIIHLPKGSPYLNAVEECWHQGKRILLVSEYYKTFVDMCSAISTYYIAPIESSCRVCR